MARDTPRSRRRRTAGLRWTAAGLAGAVLLGSCAAPEFVPPAFDLLVEPPPPDVDAVVYLVGDAGQATVEHAPLLHRLREDVEARAAALPDSSVAVLFLGDNVYPSGVHRREHPDFAQDSARLWGQAWTVDGPRARARGVRGVFLAGNHDWGNARGQKGRARLTNQSRLLAAFARGGSPVALHPEAGQAGPWVADLGSRARIVALDTHWWLQAGPDPAKDAMLRDVEAALAGRNGRETVLAAHHPFASGGPHGAGPGSPLDPTWLLHQAGAMVQDLNSGPYRALLSGLSDVFRRTGPPLVFAAGHDHSLQVIRGSGSDRPAWTLVSGAGSKLSEVGAAPGMEWQALRPGYMRLVFRRSGSVELFVVSSSSEVGACPGDGAARDLCMDEGVRSFTTTYSARLR